MSCLPLQPVLCTGFVYRRQGDQCNAIRAAALEIDPAAPTPGTSILGPGAPDLMDPPSRILTPPPCLGRTLDMGPSRPRL
jgi:hypothetical protein